MDSWDITDRPEASKELHNAAAQQLAMDAGLRMGIFRLTGTERARLLSNLARGMQFLAVKEANTGAFVAVFENLRAIQNTSVDITSSDTYHVHPLTRQFISQPMAGLTERTQRQCLAISAKYFASIWLGITTFDKHFAHAVQQLYDSKRQEWKAFRAIDLTDAREIQSVFDKSGSDTVNQFARSLHAFWGTGLPELAQFKPPKSKGILEPGVCGTPELPTEIDSEDSQSTKSPRNSTPAEPDDVSPDYDLFTTQIQRNLHLVSAPIQY